jgi:hypothetical protein
MNKYFIGREVLGSSLLIDIDETEYCKVKRYKKCLTESLEIEEKFDIVIENYKEFELELLKIGLDDVLLSNQDWHYYISSRRLISRKFSNLLSACRLYLDQTKHHLSFLFMDEQTDIEDIKKFISEQYDSFFSYRLLEALRNHMQHAGLPISTASSHKRIELTDNFSQVSTTITPVLVIDELYQSKKFKKQVLNELNQNEKRYDLKPDVRKYIECLFLINQVIRKKLDGHYQKWLASLNDITERYISQSNEDNPTIGLCAFKRNEDEFQVLERVYLFLECVNHRENLIKKNNSFSNLSNLFITNQQEKYIR